MNCPHCQEHLELKMERISALNSYGARENITALLCQNCETFMGIHYPSLIDKINSIDDEITKNQKLLEKIKR